jgi:hypothetical protein
MPAKTGIQNYLKILDSRLRGNDVKRRVKTFYGTMNDGFYLSQRQIKTAAGAHSGKIAQEGCYPRHLRLGAG